MISFGVERARTKTANAVSTWSLHHFVFWSPGGRMRWVRGHEPSLR